jgi:hypothetical protein
MTTYTWEAEETVVSGLWKFSATVKLTDLQAVAMEWKKSDHQGWEELYIRGVGKSGALGIGFRYRLGGVYDPSRQSAILNPPEKVQSAFFHRVTDQLKRRFGNDFVGWDISGPTWTLKVG